MEIISREAAKLQGLTNYFTGVPCKYGHISGRNVNSERCNQCDREKHAEYHLKNRQRNLDRMAEYRKGLDPVETAEYQKRWRDKNSEHLSEYFKNNYKENKEDKLAYQKEYRLKNLDTIKIKKHEHYIANQPEYAQRSRATEKAMYQRIPAWSTMKDTLPFYELSGKLTKETGEVHHVDHIIPLQGRYVSGLHVPANLRVIPATENLSKRNKFLPELLIQYPSEPNIQI